METIIWEVDMDLTEIHKAIIPDDPPWIIRTPIINLTLHKFHKNKTHPLIFKEELENVKERYPKYLHIFTDGFKLKKITRCATVHKGKILKKNISQMTSLYSAQKLTQSTWLLTSSQNHGITNSLSFLIRYQCWNH